MTLAVWEATTCNQLAKVNLYSKPTALDVNKDGKVAFVGSEKGILRIYDLSNRAMPRLLKAFKFYSSEIPINSVRCSHDGKYVLVSSSESDTIFLVTQDVESEFEA